MSSPKLTKNSPTLDKVLKHKRVSDQAKTELGLGLACSLNTHNLAKLQQS